MIKNMKNENMCESEAFSENILDKGSVWTPYKIGIVFLLFLVMVISYMDRVNLSMVTPTLMKQYGITPATMGFLLSLFGWSIAVSMLFIGFVVDRFHPRRVLPAGVGIWSLATVLSSISASVPFLGFTRLLLGLGESTVIPSAAKLISETFRKDQQGKVLGIYFSGTKVGAVIGTPIAAAVLAAYNWQAVFIITGILSALWLIPWFLIYRHKKEVLQVKIIEGERPVKIKWSALFANRKVWALTLGQAGYLYVYFVFLTWLPSYLIIQRHMGILKTGFLSMCPFIIAVFIGILSGWMADRWIRAGGTATMVRKTFIGSGFILSTIFIIIAAYWSAETPSLICLFMAMGVLGMVSPNINALPIDISSTRVVSSVTALQNVGGNIGGALAPMLTGLLLGWTGNFQIALLVTGLISLIFGAGIPIFMLGKIEQCIE